MTLPDRPQMTIWRMRIALRVPKATKQHSEYMILLLFHGSNCYCSAPQCMSPVLLQSLTSAGHVTVARHHGMSFYRHWTGSGVRSDRVVEELGPCRAAKLVKPANLSLLPAPTGFQMPPLGGDGQCDKTLKNARRTDG